MTIQALRQRIHDRIYGDVVEAWRGGELDDRQFGHAYRFRAQVFIPLIFFVPFAIAVAADWSERDIPLAAHLERLGGVAIVFSVSWLAVAAIIDRNARFGVRDMLLRRNRDAAEREQQFLPRDQAHGTTQLDFGSYTRTGRYWNRELLRVAASNALIALMCQFNPRVQWLLLITIPALLWALIARFDRRPYLEFSSEGIWCRAWGKQRFAYREFKAAYARRNRVGEQGLVLVPNSAEALAPQLSWLGRRALRSGERVPAHAGTLTIWTSKVGLDRDATLSALRAEISRASEPMKV
jgi:hypothetical protein